MNEWIKSFLFALGVCGLIIVVGIPLMEFVIMGNSEGWVVPYNGTSHITSAGKGWVYFYPVVDSDNQRIGNCSLAEGVYFDYQLAPCRVDYTVSWGVITSISEHVYVDTL
jgi:hypothetical protein